MTKQSNERPVEIVVDEDVDNQELNWPPRPSLKETSAAASAAIEILKHPSPAVSGGEIALTLATIRQLDSRANGIYVHYNTTALQPWGCWILWAPVERDDGTTDYDHHYRGAGDSLTQALSNLFSQCQKGIEAND
ncbi:hypothetical protein OAK19_03710 [Aureispira]|nr:hypothetical protein [Aureispira sp.]